MSSLFRDVILDVSYKVFAIPLNQIFQRVPLIVDLGGNVLQSGELMLAQVTCRGQLLLHPDQLLLNSLVNGTHPGIQDADGMIQVLTQVLLMPHSRLYMTLNTMEGGGGLILTHVERLQSILRVTKTLLKGSLYLLQCPENTGLSYRGGVTLLAENVVDKLAELIELV